MKFHTDDAFTDHVTLNTLDELKAYALGGTGIVVIDFCYPDEETGEIYYHIEAGERYYEDMTKEEE